VDTRGTERSPLALVNHGAWVPEVTLAEPCFSLAESLENKSIHASKGAIKEIPVYGDNVMLRKIMVAVGVALAL
jgi:hypothetical protein